MRRNRDLYADTGGGCFFITVQRDGARAAACMLCEIEEERAGMLTRFLYENAVEPAHTSAVLHDLCGSKVG